MKDEWKKQLINKYPSARNLTNKQLEFVREWEKNLKYYDTGKPSVVVEDDDTVIVIE